MSETNQVRDRYDVVIVGGGHGGSQAAIELRQCGFKGSIGLITDDPEQPYERPPLSKAYLSGGVDFEGMRIRPATFWGEQSIDVVTSEQITAIDARNHTVRTRSGKSIQYNDLIWSAGGRPTALGCDGADLKGIHYIRSRADVDCIKLELPNVQTVAVIGGGYIGLEAAAVLREQGKSVVVVEAADRVLARVAGETLSKFYEAEHRAKGVDLRLNAHVESIVDCNGRASAVKLADGTVLQADMVLAGIGITPNVEALIDAGAAGEEGVDVDDQCRTSLENVFAIGDCARHANRYAGGARVRLECVQNANDQAAVVAKVISGSTACYDAVPLFWSNQFDLKLQTAGLFNGFDRCIVRGATEERKFSLVYMKEGRVLALDCVNTKHDYVQGKRLITAGAQVPVDQLADPNVPLKQFST